MQDNLLFGFEEFDHDPRALPQRSDNEEALALGRRRLPSETGKISRDRVTEEYRDVWALTSRGQLRQ